ncbi:MAG TPA: hypothetical protein VK843_02855 [Planctomycetota bacterium]|nr:hypothetical protein [Planctomycetota bacterium]
MRISRSIQALCLGLCLFSGCLTPPAVIDSDEVDLAKAIERYPEGTHTVEVEVEKDVFLRGLFVPAADPAAPVVLHLLESSGSIASLRLDYGVLATQLADLGLASLFLDYTGIGASSGEPSPKYLARDARAAFAEATRRAGGDPSRVVVRAISLGTIAATELLTDGARPGGLELLEPVDGRDVVERFARRFYGRIAAWSVPLFFSGLTRLDAAELVRAWKVPILLLTPEDEALASPAWIEALRLKIALDHGNAKILPGDHFLLGVQCHALFVPEELEFLLHAFPAGPRPTPAELRRLRARWCVMLGAPKDPALREALEQLDDPAGPLPIDVLEHLACKVRQLRAFQISMLLFNADEIARMARQRGRTNRSWWTVTLTLSNGLSFRNHVDFAALFDDIVARGFIGDDARRVFARVVLKSYGIPDRVVMSAEGKPMLEAHVKGAWMELDTSEPKPDEPPEPIQFSATIPIGN